MLFGDILRVLQRYTMGRTGGLRGVIMKYSYSNFIKRVTLSGRLSRKSKVTKTAISLSPMVLNWGRALAEEKGFGLNFSG
jgi:hypothetical protein